MAQGAGVTGVGNIIVQIQGDGNSVIAGLPHLVLTRRRGNSHRILTNNDSRKPREIDVIRPFTRSIDLLAARRSWRTCALGCARAPQSRCAC